MDWVTTQGTRFAKGGQTFYLKGTNCYYLPYRSAAMRDGVLDSVRDMQMNVVRTWAFQTTLDALQAVADAARARNVYLIFTLANNWKDFGGVPAYLAAAGLTDADHDEFFTNETIKKAYRDWITPIIDRFKDDPVVLAWELINEPRSPKGNADALTSWVDEMSQYIKQRDSQHLVAVGDEGWIRHRMSFDWMTNGSTGVDSARILALPAIDFGTYHLYPDGPWGKDAEWASDQIREHQQLAEDAQKPVLLEEYGWTVKAERDSVCAQWIATLDEVDACGDLFWMMAGMQDDGTPFFDDHYTIYAAAEIPSVTGHAQLKANA